MARLDVARVDLADLRDVARGYDTVCDAVTAARAHLRGLAFDGSVAGRAHAARGDALRGAVDRIDAALLRWGETSTELALALRTAADDYARSDADAARRLG